MKEEYIDFLKFVDSAIEFAKKIPKYFSKFSKKIYTNQQKLAIYFLMQKMKATGRDIVSFLRSNAEIREKIGLKQVPVHTTICRFIAKVKLSLSKERHARIIAIDSTGFELESKSYYFRTLRNSDKKQKTKRFMKVSIVIDTDNQIILRYKIRKIYRHDQIDFKPLMKDMDVQYVVADKGYDSKENRRYVYWNLRAMPEIPYRKTSSLTKLRGAFRSFFVDEKIYHQRSKIETVFSVIKRKYGSILRNKSLKTQKIELISKLIVYNIERTLCYFYYLLEDCTRACKDIN